MSVDKKKGAKEKAKENITPSSDAAAQAEDNIDVEDENGSEAAAEAKENIAVESGKSAIPVPTTSEAAAAAEAAENIDTSDSEDESERKAKENIDPKAKAIDPEDDDEEESEKAVGLPGDDLVAFIKSHKMPLQYDVESDTFTFKRSSNLRSLAAVMAEVDGEELDTAKSASSFVPTDEDMALVNKYTGRPHEAHEIKVYAIKATDTYPDSSSERVSRKGMVEAQDACKGCAFMEDHATHSVAKAVGTIYDAQVKADRQGGHYLLQKVYVLNSPENQQMIRNIEAGIGSKVSIHMRSKRSDYLCDTCKAPMFSDKGFCGHYVGYPDPSTGVVHTASINGCARYLETSRVAIGDNERASFKSIAVSAVSDEIANLKSVADNVVRIKPASIEGATAVSDKKDQNKDSAKSAEEQTSDVSKQMEVTVKADEAIVKFSESLDAFTKDLNKSLGGVVEGLEKALTSAGETITKQAALVDDLQKGVEEQKKQHEAEIGELKERFELLFKFHQEIVENTKTLQTKTIQELVDRLSNVKVNQTSITQREQEALAKNGTDFYKSLQDQYRPSKP